MSKQANNNNYRGVEDDDEEYDEDGMMQEHEGQEEGEGEEEQELNEEEIVQVIIQLGNDILHNLGVEEPIDDVAVFFSDEFYIQFFQAAFPEIDFSQLTAGENVDEMAENIQALIDLLGEQILKYDLSHIRGQEIVNGNPEHCINLLQLVQEISVMIQQKAAGSGNGGMHPNIAQNEKDEDVDSHDEDNGIEVEDQLADLDQEHHQFVDHEDIDAEIIDEMSQEVVAPGPQQQRRGRSNSDDHRGGATQFQMEDFDHDNDDISNEFEGGQHHGNHHEDEDDELEQQFMQQLQNQPEIQKKRQSDDDDQDDDDGAIDEDDLKMYEQFLANNKQQEQQLAMMDINNQFGQHQQQPDGSVASDIHVGEAEEGIYGQEEDEEEEEEGQEIDLDNIDYDDLDPQILEIAKQMGVDPKEVLKQIMKMNSEGGGAEEEEGGENDENEDGYGEEMELDGGMGGPHEADHIAREDQLRREKEMFKQQMGLVSSDKKSQQSKMSQPQVPQKQPQQQQQQQQNQQQFHYDDEDEYGQEEVEDAESYYSENEIKTRIKLISQKSYSAPYIIISDCYPEPLCDDDDQESQNQLPSKAYSTTVLQNLELQEQMMQQNSEDQHGSNDQEDTANLLHQQQQKLIKQQQQQQQPSGNKKGGVNSNQKSNTNQQRRHQHEDDVDQDDEEEELDINISQKLQELQYAAAANQGSSNNNNRKQQMQEQEEEEGEGDEMEEGEDEDDEMLIDLDQLDDHNRQMLLEYLQQEYEKNPDQFPFPKELIEDYMLKQQSMKQQRDQEIESVKEINSQEMILEEAVQNHHQGHDQHLQIVGGGQQIEDEEDELQEDDEDGAEYLENNPDMQVQYGADADGQIIDLQQQHQLLLLQQQQQMIKQMNMKQQQYQIQQQRGKQTKKVTKGVAAGKNRPKSASRKKPQVQANIVGHQIQQQIIPEEEDEQQIQMQQIPEDQLQQLIQLLQDQQIDIENVDPNIIQQILIAQQQQQIQQNQQQPPSYLAAQSQPRSTRQQRPLTAGRKASGSKKRNKQVATKATKILQPYQQQQFAQAKSKIQATYGPHMSESITNSNKKRPLAKKKKQSTKRPGTAQNRQQMLLHQQLLQQFPNLTPQEQFMILQQQQQQQQHSLQYGDEGGVIHEEDEDEYLIQQQQLHQQQQQQIHQNEEENNDEEDGENEIATLQPHQQLLEIPNFSEEYLNQLSEEQLEQLLHQQQQLMLMQQHQQQIQSNSSYAVASRSTGKKQLQSLTKPKSAKTATSQMRSIRPSSGKGATATGIFNPYIAKNQKRLIAPVTKVPKKKRAKKLVGAQGVMMNNFFPALEGGVVDDSSAAYPPSQKDKRYPKFGLDNLNVAQQANNQNMIVQDQIDEVPPEQEEAESQENIQTAHGINFYQQSSQKGNQNNNQNDQDGQDIEGDQDNADPTQREQDEIQQDDETAGGPGIELTDEQLIDLIQNAHTLSPEQQQQLQLILQQRMKQEIVNERAQSYQNIYDILMDNVRRAKDRLAPLGQVAQRVGAGEDSEETDRRIIKQKQEFESLYRQYQNELKAREFRKKDEDSKVDKRLQRESRTTAIRERKFQEELLSHQKSLNYKRNAQQVMLCQKVYKLASDLEKNKLLQEKREYKENQQRKKLQNRLMVDAIETYYKNQVSLLKERIESERFERRVAQQAQQSALSRMKKELNEQKKIEVERYLQLLKQEDNRYEFESSNVNRIEQEIIKMYKKGK